MIMAHMQIIHSGVDVSHIYWALMENPWLWNQHTGRTQDPDSPHHGLDDIWVRFGSEDDAQSNAPHESQWYPAADVLNVQQICLDLMKAVGGVKLGGVLITRIPPGAVCKPHQDHGWHAYQYEKFLLQIASAPGQSFHFVGEKIVTKPGDVAWFNNQETHWVVNDSPYERISMIVCIKLEK